MTTNSNTSSTTIIPAGDLQPGFTVSIPYLGGRFEEKTVSTVEITKGFLSDGANVTFTDGSVLDFRTANPIIVIATEPVLTAEVPFTREQGIVLCSILNDSIGHARQGIKDATTESEIAWWESRIAIAAATYKRISDAIAASDAEVSR